MAAETFTYDWSRFTKRVNIKADVSAVYKTWATQDGLEQFFLRDAVFTTTSASLRGRHDFAQPGDTYEWRWHGYQDSMTERGEILEANGTDKIKFVFDIAGIVTVTIKTEQGETIAELLQEGIPAGEQNKVNFHLGCSTGWVFYLANLKSILEGGIDLRNKNVDLKNVVTA